MLHSRIRQTSIDAYLSVDHEKLADMVYDAIVACGENGCTASDLLEMFPGFAYSSVTTQSSILERDGRIFIAGDKRQGKTGRLRLVLRSIAYSDRVPIVRKKKISDFKRGLCVAAQILLDSSDLVEAKKLLKERLLCK